MRLADREDLILLVGVAGAVAVLVGGIVWFAVESDREKAAFIDSCVGSKRHDPWECRALWGQSQGATPPVVVPGPVGR